MALFTIIRIYEVPADNQQQATDRMLEAIRLHTEHYYHVKDIVRETGDRSKKGRPVNMKPAASWIELLKKQLGLG